MAKRKRLRSWKNKSKASVSKPKVSYIDRLQVETREQIAIVQELNLYPWMKDKDWWHTVNEGKRTPFQQWLVKAMGMKKNIPDFIFAEPMQGFNGLWIEYKKTGTPLFKEDGTPYAAVREQWEFLCRVGPKANVKFMMVAGIDNFIKAVKEYFQQP